MTDYKPFGEEWEAEVMKMKKAELVDMLRNSLKRNIRHKEALEKIVNVTHEDALLMKEIAVDALK